MKLFAVSCIAYVMRAYGKRRMVAWLVALGIAAEVVTYALFVWMML